MKPRDLVELVLLGAIWGAAFPLMRVAAPELGASSVAFMRVSIGALVLIPLVMLRGGLRALLRDARALAFVGLTGAALPFALFAYAALSVPAGFSAVLNATTPMFTAMIASVWMNEKPTRWAWAGMVVGMAGVAVLVSERVSLDSLGSLPAIVACLLASMLYGVGANYTRSRLRSADPLIVAAGMQGFAAISLAPLAAIHPPEAAVSAPAWGAVLALGFACTGIALILYFGLIRRVGPSKAVTVTFLVPVFGMLFGSIFLGESISATMLAGAAVVLAGTAMSVGLVGPRDRAAGGEG
ncbi:MAG: DMT family transporter [Burkholderiaceae bacterium]|nr:DMT family transporter [Burkholderiaceae bacterium]